MDAECRTGFSCPAEKSFYRSVGRPGGGGGTDQQNGSASKAVAGTCSSLIPASLLVFGDGMCVFVPASEGGCINAPPPIIPPSPTPLRCSPSGLSITPPTLVPPPVSAAIRRRDRSYLLQPPSPPPVLLLSCISPLVYALCALTFRAGRGRGGGAFYGSKIPFGLCPSLVKL